MYGEDAAELHVKAFLLLCSIVDVIRLLLLGVDHTVAADLPRLVRLYLVAFVAAYGLAAVKFKHHQLMHLALQILADCMALNCFVTERKNIEAKASVAHNKCKGGIERTALSRCLNAQLRKLESPGWVSHLLGPTGACPELAESLQVPEVLISRAMRFAGVSLSNGTIAFLDTGRSYLIVVVACVSAGDSWAVLVRRPTLHSKAKHWSVWTLSEKVELYRLREGETILPAAFYKYVGADSLEVIH